MQHDQNTGPSREAMIGWAAGLFEGEGSLIIYRRTPQAILVTTDHDVLLCFQRVVGVGRINGPYQTKGNKPYWRWYISGRKRVEPFLDIVEPFLGERRAARVAEVRAHMKTMRVQGGTHCRRGHEYTPDNTLWSRNGTRMKRRCRTCERGWARERLSIPPDRFRI